MTAARDLIGRKSLNGEHTGYAVPVLPRVEAAALGWGRIPAAVGGDVGRSSERGEGRRDGDSEYELVTTRTPPAFTVGHRSHAAAARTPGLSASTGVQCVGQREPQRGWRQGGMVRAEATCTAVSVGRGAAAEKPAVWDRTQLDGTNKEGFQKRKGGCR